jgi:hypothetical protein
MMCYEIARRSFSVMAELVPAIHVYAEADRRPRCFAQVRAAALDAKVADGRDKPGHDDREERAPFHPKESPPNGRDSR